jgi:hypothetical protein
VMEELNSDSIWYIFWRFLTNHRFN